MKNLAQFRVTLKFARESKIPLEKSVARGKDISRKILFAPLIQNKKREKKKNPRKAFPICNDVILRYPPFSSYLVYRLRLKNKFKSFGFAVKYRQTDIYCGYVHRVNNERDKKKSKLLPFLLSFVAFSFVFFFFSIIIINANNH